MKAINKEQSAHLSSLLQGELEASLARDPSIPGILATVIAPRWSFSWSGACGGSGLTPGHAFRIASVTKVYVSVATLRFCERGLLPLFGSVRSLVSDRTNKTLEAGGYSPANMTLYHLLTHTSGLRDHAQAAEYREEILSNPSRVWTRDEQIRRAVEMGPPLSVPGVRFSYSDTAYVIIGEILERISGKGLAAVLREELDFGGRGLSVTHFERYEACPKGLMFAPQRLGSLDIMMIDASADLFGGGGIISTTGEIAAFFRAVFRGEFFDKPETLAAGLMTPTVEPAPGEELHSVLARSRVLDGERGWAHGGFWGLGGLYLPASDIAIAMAYNQVEAGESTRGGVGIPGFTDRIGAILHRAAREFQVG